MPNEGLALQLRTLGRAACWAVFVLNLAYFFPLTIGLLTLKSPLDPISDPYITMMEVLILLMVPFMILSIVAVYYYALVAVKPSALAALAFMVLSAGLTACVHFSILTVGRQFEAAGLDWAPLIFSFKWPSVVYALDILAWDVFFPLALLFAIPVFAGSALETAIRALLIVSVILAFAGLIGVPLANMNYRNIGIVGYAIVAPVAFLLMGILFGRSGARVTEGVQSLR
jgi:hypothetical protein